MPRHWYVKSSYGPSSYGPKGPITLEKMLRLIQQGQVKPNVAVSRNHQDWRCAFRFAELPIEKASQQTPTLIKSPGHPLRRKAYKNFGKEVRRQPFRLTWNAADRSAEQGSVDVCVFTSGEDRPIKTVVTCGLSDHPLPNHDRSISSRRELIFYVG